MALAVFVRARLIPIRCFSHDFFLLNRINITKEVFSDLLNKK
jgi:hypothetical protein